MSDVTQTPQTGEGFAERLRELETRLKQKEAELRSRDQTVKDLTDRLAQAVERLDRVQRMGTDRITVSTAGFPKQVIKQQTELVEDLQRAVGAWENMQIGAGLGHLELKLSDLSALIEEHFREPEPELPEVPEDFPVESTIETPKSESTHQSSNQETQTPVEEELDFTADEICPLRPPEILNLTEATLLDLKRCVAQQESYIDYLSGRLQRAAENSTSVDWRDLATKPEALNQKLERTATKLQQSRHFAEFEVALQFTRLRRKERELKQVSGELAAQMQALGKSPEADANKDAAGSRRWMRMLGMGKNETE